MSSLNRVYGWKPDLPDHRDKKFLPTVTLLPPLVDLRPLDVPIYDQKNLGSCTGNAWAGHFQFVQKKEGKPSWEPSRLFIYYNERVIDGTVSQDAGAALRDGAKTLASQGTCAESIWSYNISKFA